MTKLILIHAAVLTFLTSLYDYTTKTLFDNVQYLEWCPLVAFGIFPLKSTGRLILLSMEYAKSTSKDRLHCPRGLIFWDII